MVKVDRRRASTLCHCVDFGWAIILMVYTRSDMQCSCFFYKIGPATLRNSVSAPVSIGSGRWTPNRAYYKITTYLSDPAASLWITLLRVSVLVLSLYESFHTCLMSVVIDCEDQILSGFSNSKFCVIEIFAASLIEAMMSIERSSPWTFWIIIQRLHTRLMSYLLKKTFHFLIFYGHTSRTHSDQLIKWKYIASCVSAWEIRKTHSCNFCFLSFVIFLNTNFFEKIKNHIPYIYGPRLMIITFVNLIFRNKSSAFFFFYRNFSNFSST